MAQAHIQRTNGLTASAANVIHILAGCRDGAATKFPSDTIHLVVGSPESAHRRQPPLPIGARD
jgi:hypothetical protein